MQGYIVGTVTEMAFFATWVKLVSSCESIWPPIASLACISKFVLKGL